MARLAGEANLCFRRLVEPELVRLNQPQTRCPPPADGLAPSYRSLLRGTAPRALCAVLVVSFGPRCSPRWPARGTRDGDCGPAHAPATIAGSSGKVSVIERPPEVTTPVGTAPHPRNRLRMWEE
jgi:hypothetical protein